MGGRPSNHIAAEAERSISQAADTQRQEVADIRQRGATYETKGLERLANLQGLSGTTMKDYISKTLPEYEAFTQGLTAKYEPLLKSYSPDILSSSSMSQLKDVLRESAGEFKQGVQDVSEEGSARLYKTLAAPLEQFSRAAQNPAFNLQLDPQAVALAVNPPMRRSDVKTMLNELTQYNV